MLPTWTDEVTAVATAVTAVGVVAAVVGVFLAKEQVARAKEEIQEGIKGRHADIAIDMSRRWDEDGMLEARNSYTGLNGTQVLDLFKSLLESNDDDKLHQYFKMQRVGNYFEDFAVLEKFDLVALEWINDTVGGAAIQYWKRLEPSVVEDRRTQRTLYENWGKLVARLEELRVREASKASNDSPTGPASDPSLSTS
jgi:hypothetical protein